MDYFAQQALNGLSLGLIYAGLALALVLVYQASGALNIAQGELASFSTFMTWSALAAGIPWPLAAVLVVIASFALGVLIDAAVLRRVRQGSELTLLISTLALLLIFNATIGLTWGYFPRTLDSPYGVGRVAAAGVTITFHELGMALTMVLALGLTYALLRYTTVGLKMRAAAQNPLSARLLGLPVSRLLGLGWGFAAALGAVVGMVSAPLIGLDTTVFLNVLLYSFAAAILGGLTSVPGAIAAGLVIGLAQTLSAVYVPAIGSDLNVIVPFALILVVLLIRPQGLFGRPGTERV